MPRTVHDRRLETRTARARLTVSPEPYWTLLSEGFHLGYYRGRTIGKWVARFRPKGGKGGYSKTTLGLADDTQECDNEDVLDYRSAQERARAWESRLKNHGGRKPKFTVGMALDQYLANYTGKDLANTTRRVEKLIRPVLGHIIVADLKAKDIRSWMLASAKRGARLRTGRFEEQQKLRSVDSDDAQRRRKSTVNRDWTVLRAALNQAFLNDEVASDVEWRKVKPFPGVERARIRYLEDDEVRSLVAVISNDIRPLVMASLLTGARYGELRRIRVSDFDRSAAVVWLRETKAATSRPCFLEDEGVALFASMTDGKASEALVFPAPDGAEWRDSQQIRRMAAASRSAGLEATSFHDLRRTFGARLAKRGVTMSVIAEALGHADERVTKRHYAHLAPSYVSGTIREHTKGLNIMASL